MRLLMLIRKLVERMIYEYMETITMLDEADRWMWSLYYIYYGEEEEV